MRLQMYKFILKYWLIFYLGQFFIAPIKINTCFLILSFEIFCLHLQKNFKP